MISAIEEASHPINWLNHLSFHIPLAIVLLLSIVLVTVVCSMCLAIKFEFERKKYVAWKSQPSSGYSTPNLLDNQNYNRIEDIHTSSGFIIQWKLLDMIFWDRKASISITK